MKTPKTAKPKTLKDAKKPKADAKKSPLSTYFAKESDKRVESQAKSPPLSLLAKLGSVAVHAEELLSPDGHSFDRTALEQILRDPEVTAWIKDMGPLLPRKRSS